MTPEQDGLFYYIVVFMGYTGWIAFFDIVISFWFSVVRFSKLLKDLKESDKLETYQVITFYDKIGSIMYWQGTSIFIGWIHPRVMKYLISDRDDDNSIIQKDKKILKSWVVLFYAGWAMILFLLILGFISFSIFAS